MKRTRTNFLLICILLVGLSLLLYPTISNQWNSLHQSQAIVDYKTAMKDMVFTDYSAIFAEAEAYNAELATIPYPLMNHSQIERYAAVLNISGTGIMGYLTIPKLDVELPIYHGTEEAVLQKAVGHLEGTSLPIGGIGNHSVLSAHRGLPRAKLFTDLDKMEPGDCFTITVLDRQLTYQVDQILVVEPREVDALYPVAGMDYCTLITCTPYGINSHRLLVRGIRVENPIIPPIQSITADAVRMDYKAGALILASPILLLLMTVTLLPSSAKKRRSSHG